MVKKILDYIRFIFISPELCIGLAAFFCFTTSPDIVEFMATYLFKNEVDLEHYLKLLILPISVLAMTYKFADNILNPENEANRKILKEWQSYWMLKNRIYYSLTLSLLSLIGSLIGWYYALNTNLNSGTLILLICWVVSLTSFSTIALGRLQIKEILY